MDNKKTIKNTFMLYLMTIAKMIFPLLTLPYLTRVLSKNVYGTVSYVKSCMVYFQLFIDFGFLLSATKDIVLHKDDKEGLSYIFGETLLAKIFISILCVIFLIILLITLPILRNNIIYTILAFIAIFLSVFLPDFLFRGLEKMEFVTITYVVMKGVSTILTFVFVKNDNTVLFVPILDIIGTLVAVAISWIFVIKEKIRIKISNLYSVFIKIKDSFSYFASNIATTAFGAFITIVLGVFYVEEEVALWTVSLQIIQAIQNLYSPISNGIYPQMIKHKSLKFFHKIILFLTPIIIVGCIMCYFLGDIAIIIIGGEEYLDALPIFFALIPLLFTSFYSIMYGWPTLGTIGKAKEVSIITSITAVLQCLSIVGLILFNKLTFINVAITRNLTELFMMMCRIIFTYKYKNCFIAEHDDSNEGVEINEF